MSHTPHLFLLRHHKMYNLNIDISKLPSTSSLRDFPVCHVQSRFYINLRLISINFYLPTRMISQFQDFFHFLKIVLSKSTMLNPIKFITVTFFNFLYIFVVILADHSGWKIDVDWNQSQINIKMRLDVVNRKIPKTGSGL